MVDDTTRIFPYFCPCIPTTYRAGNPLIFYRILHESSLLLQITRRWNQYNLPWYTCFGNWYRHIFCCNFIQFCQKFYKFLIYQCQCTTAKQQRPPHRCIGQNCDLHRLRQGVSCLPHLRLPAHHRANHRRTRRTDYFWDKTTPATPKRLSGCRWDHKFYTFLFKTIERCAILFHKRPPCCR